MDEAVRRYIDAIPAEHRPLFDRLHGLVLAVHPDAAVVLSYDIPTYKVGRRPLFLAAWQHGISIYGRQADPDAGLSGRHAVLKSVKTTIQVRQKDHGPISDVEF